METIDRITMLLGVENITPEYKKTVQDFVAQAESLSDLARDEIAYHLAFAIGGRE